MTLSVTPVDIIHWEIYTTGEILKINCAYSRLVGPETLVPNPKNPNVHPEKQIDLLAKIIEHTGQRAPIVVSERSGFVIKGHGRLEAIKKLGWRQCAIDIQTYQNEAEEFSDMVADNKIAELSDTDGKKLVELIQADQNLMNLDFDFLGIPDFELPNPADELPDDQDDKPKKPKKMKMITCPNCENEFEQDQAESRLI